MSKYKNITGLWAGKIEGSYSFKMTDAFKDEIVNIPNGTYVNVTKNKYKQQDNHPDLQMSYKLPESGTGFVDVNNTPVSNSNPF